MLDGAACRPTNEAELCRPAYSTRQRVGLRRVEHSEGQAPSTAASAHDSDVPRQDTAVWCGAQKGSRVPRRPAHDSCARGAWRRWRKTEAMQHSDPARLVAGDRLGRLRIGITPRVVLTVAATSHWLPTRRGLGRWSQGHERRRCVLCVCAPYSSTGTHGAGRPPSGPTPTTCPTPLGGNAGYFLNKP